MIYKTLACTAALSFALSATAYAQDKSTTQPVKAEAKKMIKIDGVKGEAQDKAMSGGEDRLTENLSITNKTDGLGAIIAVGAVEGGGGGKVDVQDISVSAKNPKIDGIKGEATDKSPACVTEAGAADADCNGVPDPTAYDRTRPTRPAPRIQRR